MSWYKKTPYYIVQWLDASAGNEWEDVEDLDKWEPVPVWSGGWLAKDHKDYIILVGDYHEATCGVGRRAGFGAHRLIPRNMVVSMKKIKI